MIEIKWQPSNKDLRIFATAFLVVAVGFGLTFYLNVGLTTLVKALWIAGPTAFALGMIWPQSLKYVYIGLTIIAFPIGFVIGNLLLAIVFYLIVTPVGLIFKLLGKDLLHRKLDPQAATYWIERPPTPGAGRYFRQF